MPAVLVTVPMVTQNSLHPLSTSSIIAHHLLYFSGAGKSNRGRCTDSPSGRHPIRTIGAPTFVIPPFLHQMPFQPQPSQFILAWDRRRMMLAYVVAWFVVYKYMHHYLTITRYI